MGIVKNTHDTNNLVVRDNTGAVRVLAPGQSVDTGDRAQYREEALSISRARAAAATAKRKEKETSVPKGV